MVVMWPFRKAAHVPEPMPWALVADKLTGSESERQAGATFGPWADHESRCKCNVCR